MIIPCLARPFRLMVMIFALMFVQTGLNAQHFIDESAALGVDYSASAIYGNGISVYDWDKDGWDDIALLRGSGSPKFYNNNEGSFEELSFPGLSSLHARAAHLLWVDYDNDGDSDLSICSTGGKYWLYKNDGEFNFEDVSLELNLTPVDSLYGHCWGDFDRDGDLDVYFSVYASHLNASQNFFYRNDDGVFNNVTEEYGVGNGLAPTFQSVWADINNDNWPDLALINDRPNHHNEIYLNNEGSFTPIATESGFDYYMDAMTNTPGDFDNDGDLDFYITAGVVDGNAFFINNGDLTFTEVAENYGIQVFNFCWSAQWLDINNDGLLDLLVNSQIVGTIPNYNRIFLQNEDHQFEEYVDSGITQEFSETFTSGIGDFNNDGAIDFITHSYTPFGTEVWINQFPQNHHLRIRPEGVISNRDGVGVWMHVHAGDLNRHHYTLCGEAFLGQNSNWVHFGLAEHNLIDSIVLEWPSGHVDRFYNVEADQSLHLIEGSSLSLSLNYTDSLLHCSDGPPLELTATEGFDSYLWSTGETSPSILISESGVYSVSATTSLGFELNSDSVSIHFGLNPQVEAEITPVSCFGLTDGAIALSTDAEIESIIWNADIEGLTPDSLSASTYTYVLSDSLGCWVEGEVTLLSPPEILYSASINPVSCFGLSDGSATLTVENATDPQISWETGMSGDTLTGLEAGDYAFTVISAEGCSISSEITIPEAPQLLVAEQINNLLCHEDQSGSINLSLEGTTSISQVEWEHGASGPELDELEAGTYNYILTDSQSCTVEGTVTLTQPEALLALLEVVPGSACPESWDGIMSLSGGTPPFQFSWSFYIESELVEVLNQVTSWQCMTADELVLQVTDANDCTFSLSVIPSEITGVPMYADPSAIAFPNPTNGRITVIPGNAAQYALYDALGKNLLSGQVLDDELQIDLSPFASGVYFLQLTDEHSVQTLAIQKH